jgi:hypothetical protein
MDILLLTLIVILVSEVVILVVMTMIAIRILAEVAPKKRLVPQLPFWSGGSIASSFLISLLPTGIGLSFNTNLNRYKLMASEAAILDLKMI